MADVFVVALFIAYLAAKASTTAPGSAAPTLVAFSAHFGAGFYWFTAYCLFSLASQQVSVRMAAAEAYTFPFFISSIRWSQPRTASAMIVSVGFWQPPETNDEASMT